MRATKIVCTIGPASQSPEVLNKMVELGMDVARVNFSHGSRSEHRTLLARVRRAAQRSGKVVGLLADIPGPKLRISDLSSDPLLLEEGHLVSVIEADTVTTSPPVAGTDGTIAITRLGVIEQLKPGDAISFADGVVQVRVHERLTTNGVTAVVEIGGTLIRRKGVNFPESSVILPALTDADEDHIRFAVAEGFDFIAISFVGDVSDVIRAREVASSVPSPLRPRIVSKIERPNALLDIEAIIRASDAVMVARGDLGVEIAPEAVPIEQKRIIHLCNEIGRPVITATQMLESMVHAPLPTRAEATDVANAILDGTDAIMLSAETAAGEYPLEAVSYMDRIARRTERERLNFSITHMSRPTPTAHTVADAIALSAFQISSVLSIRAVIAVTESGHSARVVAKYRPLVPIIGAAVTREAAGSLTLSFGVTPVVVDSHFDLDQAMVASVDRAVSLGLVAAGDLVLLVAGLPFGVSGTTNLLKIQKVGDPIFDASEQRTREERTSYV